MSKTSEKHVKKYSHIGSIVHQRHILLIAKVQILFLFIYICFLTSTIKTKFFDFPSPLLIKTRLLIRYLENFQTTILLRPLFSIYLALNSILNLNCGTLLILQFITFVNYKVTFFTLKIRTTLKIIHSQKMLLNSFHDFNLFTPSKNIKNQSFQKGYKTPLTLNVLIENFLHIF